METRKAFNHYRSFWEVKKLLSDKQYVEFDKALCQVQFLEIHIDDISFNEQLLQLVWASVKHSIKSSVEGYRIKKNLNYNQLKNKQVRDACQGGTQGGCQEGKGKGKGKGKEEVKEKEKAEKLKKFFSLWKKTPFKKIRSITETRKNKILNRLNVFSSDEIFEALKEQEILKDQSWFDIDFLIKNDENCEKIINRKYKNIGKSFNYNQVPKNFYYEDGYEKTGF